MLVCIWAKEGSGGGNVRMGAYVAVGGWDELIGIVRVAKCGGDVEGWSNVDCAGEVVVGVDGDGGRRVFGQDGLRWLDFVALMIVRHCGGGGVGQGLMFFGGRSATATASIFEMVR